MAESGTEGGATILARERLAEKAVIASRRAFPHRCTSCGRYGRYDLQTLRDSYDAYRANRKQRFIMTGVWVVILWAAAIFVLVKYGVEGYFIPLVIVSAIVAFFAWRLIPITKAAYDQRVEDANDATVAEKWLALWAATGAQAADRLKTASTVADRYFLLAGTLSSADRVCAAVLHRTVARFVP
jgi:hypothetical protein